MGLRRYIIVYSLHQQLHRAIRQNERQIICLSVCLNPAVRERLMRDDKNGRICLQVSRTCLHTHLPTKTVQVNSWNKQWNSSSSLLIPSLPCGGRVRHGCKLSVYSWKVIKVCFCRGHFREFDFSRQLCTTEKYTYLVRSAFLAAPTAG